jgi:hypothetical protein
MEYRARRGWQQIAVVVWLSGCASDKPSASSGPAPAGTSSDTAAHAGAGSNHAGSTGVAPRSAGGTGAASNICDDAPASEASCGDTMCRPIAVMSAQGVCTRTCCTDAGKCGTRVTSRQNGQSGMVISGACIESAAADTRCPAMMNGGRTFPGCCDPTGHCGQLAFGICAAVGTARACDAQTADTDAGL